MASQKRNLYTEIPAVSFEQVNFSYHSPSGEVEALNNLSLCVFRGEFVAIVGPSGCGKSTLLSMLAGLLSPASGTLRIFGDIPSESKHRVGYMLQKDHLLNWRTNLSNATLGPEITHTRNEKTIFRADNLFQTYGLISFEHQPPSALSGGMRQRVALIRTLLMEPDLLLLDEPFSALDYQTRLAVSDDICTLIRKEQKTALLVTHDISEAISIADRIFVLTKRPAQVKSVHDISLTLPENEAPTPLLRRSAPEFSKYFNTIWEELKQNE